MDLSFATFYWKNPVTKQFEFLFAKKAGKGDKFNFFYHETPSFAEKLYGDVLGLIGPYEPFKNTILKMPKPHQKTQIISVNNELHKVYYIYINYNYQLIKSISQFKDYLDKCPQIANSCQKYPYSVYNSYTIFTESQVLDMIKNKQFTDRALEALANFATVRLTLNENLSDKLLTLPLSASQTKMGQVLIKSIKNKKAMGDTKVNSQSYLAQLAQIHLDYYESLKKPYKDALDYYTQNGYKTINGYLRGNILPTQLASKGITEDSLKLTINNLNQVLVNAPVTTQAMTVYRGVNFDNLPKFNTLKPGQVVDIFRDSFNSTSFSLNISTGDEFSGQECCLFVVHLPPGVKGIYIGKASSNSGEDEFILAPGPLFRVMKFKHEKVPQMGMVKTKPDLRFYHLYCVDCQQAYEKYNNIVYYNLVGPALAVSKTPTEATHKSPIHSPIDKEGKITSKKVTYTKTHKIEDESKTLVGLSKYVMGQPLTHMPIKDTKFKSKAKTEKPYQYNDVSLFVATFKLSSNQYGLDLSHDEIMNIWNGMLEKHYQWMAYANMKLPPSEAIKYLDKGGSSAYDFFIQNQSKLGYITKESAKMWLEMTPPQKSQWLKAAYTHILPVNNVTPQPVPVTIPQPVPVIKPSTNSYNYTAQSLFTKAYKLFGEKNGISFTDSEIATMWTQFPSKSNLDSYISSKVPPQDLTKFFDKGLSAGFNFYLKTVVTQNVPYLVLWNQWTNLTKTQKDQWEKSAYTLIPPVDNANPLPAPAPIAQKIPLKKKPITGYNWFLKEQYSLAESNGTEKPSIMKINQMWGQLTQSEKDKYTANAQNDVPTIVPNVAEIVPPVAVVPPEPAPLISNIDSKYYDGLQLHVLTKLKELAKDCPPNMIKNPKSGICVGISGKVGKGVITSLTADSLPTDLMPIPQPNVAIPQPKVAIPLKSTLPVPPVKDGKVEAQTVIIPNIDPIYLDGLSITTLKLIQKLSVNCGHNTIKNWKTGHCVMITGTLGKKLIKELIANPDLELKYI